LQLHFRIDLDVFAEQLSCELHAGSLRVVDAIERMLGEHLEASVSNGLGEHLKKRPRAVVHPGYFKNRFANLSSLSESGYKTWYPEVSFSTYKGRDVAVTSIEYDGFDLGIIRYWEDVEERYRYRRKELKTQDNHKIKLNELMISGEVFDEVIQLTNDKGNLNQPYIANLMASFNIVAFDHVLSGERRFCSCHADAHTAMLELARRQAPSYASDSSPHHTIRLLENAKYSENVCHLCIVERHGEDALVEWYGTQFQKHFEPYVALLMHQKKLDHRTAKAEVMRRLSLDRWVREAELHRLIAQIFPAETVRREASPSWLGRQRLDIYLPKLGLAVEYQGEQHFRPIAAFGGEQAFAKNQERDKRKRDLCKKNGVTVVDVRFDESLTLPHIRSRLRRWFKE
jgi:hypothetical protein